MNFIDQLDIYLRARFTLIILVTTEEERALQLIKDLCDRTKRNVLTWDVADGFQSLTQSTKQPPVARDALTALELIDKAEGNDLYILKDFHEAWTNIQLKRKLRSVSQKLKFTRKSIIITSTQSKIPDELHDEAVLITLPLPSAPELNTVLDGLAQTSGMKVNLTPLGREKLVQAALGLTANQSHPIG